tara:strand:+ start:2917 stop:3621 length:705 start_codon:yes stop_codon:yes gene_type:complete
MTKKILPCFILSRKNSKGLKNKNTYKFNNKPLIQHTIDFAKKSKNVTHIVISTDDPKVVPIAKRNKCILIYPRPKYLSHDNAISLYALQHAAKYIIDMGYNFDIYGFLQITEPLRPKFILDKCIQKLKKNKKINSVFAGFTFKKNFWINKNKNFKIISPVIESTIPRQKRKIIYREDCGVSLASRKNVLLKKNKLYIDPVSIIPYNSFEGLLDIHSKKDILLGEYLSKYVTRQK